METFNVIVWIFACTVLCAQIASSQKPPATTVSSRKFVNVTVVQQEPYIKQNGDGSFSGYLPDFFEMLSDEIPYDFGFYLAPDGRYGHFSNGSWAGMMGEIVSGAADLTAPLTRTFKRNQFVDFTFPLQSIDSAIVLRRPPKGEPTIHENLVKLLAPLEFPVWLVTVLAFLVTSTVVYIISNTNPYEWRRMAKDKEATLREAESFTCLNSFWFVISTLAWQGYVRAPRSMGGRITVTAWWFFVLIFILSYTASLTNYLRVGPLPMEAEGYSTIKSLDDLSDNDNVRVGILASGATRSGFKNSVYSKDQKLYQKSVEFENSVKPILTYNEGIEYLRSRAFMDFAMIMESPSAKFVVHQSPCDLYMVSDHRATRFNAMAVTKNSPILGYINSALLRLYESGKMTQLEKKWFEQKCNAAVLEAKKETYKIPTFYKLDLGTFSGALLILLVGLVIGGLVSFIETCIFKWAESHPEEDEQTNLDQNDLTSSELIPSESKHGGVTQV